jgi:hypothetical protein
MSHERNLMYLLILLALALFLGCNPSDLPPEPERPLTLIRHISKIELESIPDTGTPCCMDGFISNGNPGSVPEILDSLTTQVPCWQYFNVLHVPPSAWGWMGPWWETLSNSLIEWDALLVTAEKDTAFYFATAPEYGGFNYMIDWAQIDSVKAQVLIDVMLETSPGCSLFLDHYWNSLRWWMFSELQGATLLDFTPEHREEWARRLHWFVMELRSHKGVITNGEWAAPPPLYLEHAATTEIGTWGTAIEIWKSDPRNVLSVSIRRRAWVDSAIARWLVHGGRLAFTERPSDWAYEKAERARRE